MFYTQPLQAMRALLSHDTSAGKVAVPTAAALAQRGRSRRRLIFFVTRPYLCAGEQGCEAGSRSSSKVPLKRRRRTGVTMCSFCIAPTLRCDQSLARVSYHESHINNQLPCQHHSAM